MKTDDVYKMIMRQYRCPYCNRLLFKGKLRGKYHIETKCPRPQCARTIIITNDAVISKDVNENNMRKEWKWIVMKK